jgi:hypothetical protein
VFFALLYSLRSVEAGLGPPFQSADHRRHRTKARAAGSQSERNRHLNTVTDRTHDNFPNPVTGPNNPYAPINTPALTDLFDLFQFDHCPLCNL